MTALSLVDQGPVSLETGPVQTLRHSVELARLADDLGYHRYWLAEHHGVRNMAIAAPEILVGHIVDRTRRIRVGTGGIMLPNHSPLHVAEQFRTLEALYPGRIDLGIGRSTGTGDESTRGALLRTPDGPQNFGRHLRQLLTVGGRRSIEDDDPYARLLASPTDAPLPGVFVLGSSVGSAETAARLGLGYAFFAVYQDPQLAVQALRRYRASFAPASPEARPWAILATRVWVGADDAHAEALAASERLATLDYLTGNPQPLEPMEAALARQLTGAQLAARDKLDTRSDVVGDTAGVSRRLAGLVDTTGADEVMAVSNIHDPAERRESIRRLATAVGVSPVVVG